MGIVPFILNLSIRWRWVVGQLHVPSTLLQGKNRASLDILEMRKISCLLWNSNPRSSRPYPGHPTTCASLASNTVCVWWKWKIRNKMWEMKHYGWWFQTVQFLYLVERLFQPSDLTLVCNHWETNIHSVNQEFSASYWIQKVIAVFTRTFIGILSWTTRTQPTSSACIFYDPF